MIDAILYLLLVVGCCLVVLGRTASRFPEILSKDEAKQAMLGAFGGHIMIYGAVFACIPAFILWVSTFLPTGCFRPFPASI